MAKFNLVAQLQLQAPGNIRAIVNQIQRQLGSVVTNVKLNSNIKNIRATSTAIGLIDTESRRASSGVNELGRTMGIAARRFGAISIATGGFLFLTRAIKNSVGEAIAFERELNKITQATGATGKALSAVGDEVTRLASGLGVSSKELIGAARTLAQAGFSAKNAAGALKILAQTELAATFDSIADTTEGVVATIQQFGKEAIKSGKEIEFLEQSLSAINTVSKLFAVESADIITAIRKTGGSFEAAGGNVNELIALFTSVRATTRESADTIATAFRTIFTRLQRTETIDALRELGIVLQDSTGKFVGPLKAIEELSIGLSVLDTKDFRFSQIVEELGGFRQIGKVIPLVKQFAITQEALNAAQNASGSLAQDAATAQDTLAVRITKVQESFLALVRDFTASDTFQTMASFALDFANALISVGQAIKPILPLVTAFAAVQIGKTLIPAVGAFSGITRRNQGGPIHKFATGGFVPGTGNRDTVPAMLSPGEFVIKKASAAKLGADALNHMNASGDVQYFADGGVAKKQKIDNIRGNIKARSKDGGILDQDRVGVLVLESEDNVNKSQKSSVGNITSKMFGDSAEAFDQSKINKSYGVIRSGISDNIKDNLTNNIRDSITNGLFNAIEATGNLFAPELKIDTPLIQNKYKPKFLSSIGEDTIGTMFEAMISSISDPSFAKTADKTRPFDYIGSINKAERLFDGNTRGIKYRDAKATLNAASTSNLMDKVVSQAKKEAYGFKGNDSPAASSSGLASRYSSGAELERALIKAGFSASKVKNDIGKKAAIESLGFDAILTPRKGGGSEWELIRKASISASTPVQASPAIDPNKANRSVGYIDSDVLNDPKNREIVSAEMRKLGITKISEYKRYLLGIAANARKSGAVSKATTVFGVPGAGKSTLALGGKNVSTADNATLRKTNRFPILTASDIARSNEIVDATASLDPKYISEYVKDFDRLIILSSSEKDEQEEIVRRRKIRDSQIASGTDTTGFGRSAGSTKGAPTSSLQAEALAIAELGDKTSILGLKNYRKKSESQLPIVEKKRAGLLYGAFSPTTAGHTAVLDRAKAQGIEPKDFIAAVGIDTPPKASDEHSQRTAIFNQQLRSRIARASFKGANITDATAETFGFAIPPVFDVGTDEKTGRRKFIRPTAGSVAFVGDEKESKSLEKYKEQGFEVQTLERINDISGTKARAALLSGDLEQLRNLVTPEAFNILSDNSTTLRNRNDLLPEIFARSKIRTEKKLSGVLAELAKYPAVLTQKIKQENPELEGIVGNLRKQRDAIKSSGEKLPLKYLEKLAKLYPEKYGVKFAKGGAAGTDTVPAMLTPGEFVVKKASAQKIGYDALNYMNRTGEPQKFATGGPVGKAKIFNNPGSRLNQDIVNNNAQGKAGRARVTNNDVQALSGVLTPAQLYGAENLQRQALGLNDNSAPSNPITTKINKKAPGDAAAETPFLQGLNDAEVQKVLSLYEKQILKGVESQKALTNAETIVRKQQETKAKTIEKDNIQASKTNNDSGAGGNKKDPGIDNTAIASGQLAQNFLFMGGAITSVISQMGLFDQQTANLVSQFAVTSASVFGIGSTIIESIGGLKLFNNAAKIAAASNIAEASASNASAAADLTEASASTKAAVSGKGAAIAQGALLGLSVGIAAAGVAINQYTDAQKKATESAAEEIKSVREGGKGSLESVTKKLQDATRSNNRASAATVGGYSGAAGGALAGAAGGAALGSVIPILGTAIGAALGGIVGGVIGGFGGAKVAGDRATTSNPELAAAEYSAKAQYTAAKATYDFSKSLEDAKQKNLNSRDSLKSLTDQTNKLSKSQVAARIASRQAEINRTKDVSTFGSLLGYTPENSLTESDKVNAAAEKASIEELAATAREAATQLKSSTDQQVSEIIASSKSAVVLKNVLKDPAISGALNAYKGALIESGKSQNEADAIIKSSIDVYAKQIKSANENIIAQNALIAAKEAEVNLILQTNAALNSLVQSSRAFQAVQNGLDRTIAGLDGSFKSIPTNLGDQLTDITRVGNQSDFANTAKQAAAPLGAAGQVFAQQVSSSAQAIERLRTGLNIKNVENVTKGQLNENAGKDATRKLLSGIIGANTFAGLGKDLQDSLIGSIQSSGGTGAQISQDTIQGIIKQFETNAQGMVEVLKRTAELSDQYLSQYDQVTTAIISSMNKEADLRAGLINIQQVGQDRLAEVFKGRLSEAQQDKLIKNKDVSTTRAAQATLGPTLSGVKAGNVGSLSNALRTINTRTAANNTKLGRADLSNKERAVTETNNKLLADASVKVTNELTRLADQSAKASDIMSQISKEQAKRDFARGQVEDFVLGTQDSRQKQAETFQGANIVAQTGSFQTLPEEMRKSVGDLLKQIADLEPGGVADNIRKNAITNDAVRAGLPPQVAQALANATPKEEKLINDLRALNEQEKAAQQALIDAQRVNTDTASRLIASVDGLLTTIANNFKNGPQALQNPILAQPLAQNNQAPQVIDQGLGKLVTSMEMLSQNFNNMEMTHNINITGQVNIAGFNSDAVGKAITQSIGGFIVATVNKTLNDRQNSLRTG